MGSFTERDSTFGTLKQTNCTVPGDDVTLDSSINKRLWNWKSDSDIHDLPYGMSNP
jgi:hypothetical protein